MRQITAVAAVALLSSFCFLACSGNPGGSGSDGGSGVPEDVAVGSAEASDAGAAPAAGKAGETGAPRDSGGEWVVLRGSVAASTGVSLRGATVEIVGANPANSTTVGADGAYSLTVPPGNYFVRASKPGALAAQVAIATSRSTEVTELGLLATSLVGSLAARLGSKFEQSKGLVVVGFATADNGVGYGAKLSADHGPSFAITSRGVPQDSATTLSGGSKSLFFPNVATGMTSVTFAAPDGRTCAPKVPMDFHRVDADVITEIVAECQ